MSDKNKVVVPIGPQHPSLKEPGSFKITLDGEKVERAVVEECFAEYERNGDVTNAAFNDQHGPVAWQPLQPDSGAG